MERKIIGEIAGVGKVYVCETGIPAGVSTAKLVGKWCTCKFVGADEIVYPVDGECSCGIYKHHVHRLTCGHVTQVG